MEFIDLRSDTVSHMTDNMKQAMLNAKVGDNVYNDDPTTIELENIAAEMTGKEAALYVPTGTFGNEASIIAHCNRGDEILVGDVSHIVAYETGGPAFLGGVLTKTLKTTNGLMDINDIKSSIRFSSDDIHFPTTKLICLENALVNGEAVPIQYMKDVWNLAKEKGLSVHLDGARLFNAATALNCDPKEITQYCDSVTFCLSKGLCCAMGSIVCGTAQFIKKLRLYRKMLGGGMRQTGYMAATGIVALKELVPELKNDHAMARLLASELSKIPNVVILNPKGNINLVFFQIKDEKLDCDSLVKFLLDQKIKISIKSKEDKIIRFVTHYWIREKEVEHIVSSFKKFLEKMN